MQTDSRTITTTAACDMGRCGSCRGVVLSLTAGHLTRCQHVCHLPDAWKEQATLTPPCDQDVDLAPIEDDELENLLDIEADRQLEDEWAWS
jgi:hypothetical protein